MSGRLALVMVMAGALSAASATAAASAPPPAPPPPTPTTSPLPLPGTATSTAAASTTTTSTTSTTLPPVPPGTFNPSCVRVVRPGDSISLLADEIAAPEATSSGLSAENRFGGDHTIHPGDLLDVCVGNGVDDISGASRLRPPTTLISDDDIEHVELLQQKLNDLFGPHGMTPLTVDGISGPLTRQQLCAARVLLGLPVSRSDMAAGSDEESKLLALTSAPTPPGVPSEGDRWALVDITCQVMFVGDDATGVRFVFPTSTGLAEFPTREVSEARAFRFDPATDNGGWHDSSEFPASFDNALNGNMYKPVYFSNGQAIHGANSVPTLPASHGCARLRLDHQDQLLAWLGLGDTPEVVWAESRINLTVTTQGTFSPDP